MNKYQEALERLENIERVSSCFIKDVVKELTATFGELVEKETPLKPILKGEYGAFNDIRLINYCPNCSKQIINVWLTKTYTPQYCPSCGQKLDWSKEDERN